MRRMLVSRISRRVLCQHHIALSDSLAGRDGENPQDHVGIIYTQLNARTSIEKCSALLRQRPRDIDSDVPQELKNAAWPEVIVDGHLDTKFAYIKEHFEYMVFELLKNVRRTSLRSIAMFNSSPTVHALHKVAPQGCSHPATDPCHRRCRFERYPSAHIRPRYRPTSSMFYMLTVAVPVPQVVVLFSARSRRPQICFPSRTHATPPARQVPDCKLYETSWPMRGA